MSEEIVVRKSLKVRTFEYLSKPLVSPVILLILLIVVFVLFYIKLKAMQNDISVHDNLIKSHVFLYHDRGFVDLSTPAFQELNNNLKGGKFNVVQHLDGVKVSGIILNTSSVGLVNSNFKITIGTESKTFSVNNIPVGAASFFDVFIPNVPMNESRYANLVYLDGQISYKLNFR